MSPQVWYVATNHRSHKRYSPSAAAAVSITPNMVNRGAGAGGYFYRITALSVAYDCIARVRGVEGSLQRGGVCGLDACWACIAEPPGHLIGCVSRSS
jgi:hypothetical protein